MKQIYKALTIVLILVLVIGAASLGVFLAEAPEKVERDEREQIPIAVTVVGVDKVLIISTGLFSADSTASFPLVEMRISDEETIIGIIDITSLEEGDEILIIEDWKHGRQNTFRGYDWYRFAGYQEDGIETQET